MWRCCVADRLFVPIRECVCCGCTAPAKARRSSEAPAIMGLNLGMYRPALHVKNQHRAAGSLSICETCFASVMAEGRRFLPSGKSARFLAAVRGMLSRSYNSLIAEDQESKHVA
jgi:hypothetical protein